MQIHPEKRTRAARSFPVIHKTLRETIVVVEIVMTRILFVGYIAHFHPGILDIHGVLKDWDRVWH